MDEPEQIAEQEPEESGGGFKIAALPRGGRRPTLAKLLKNHQDVYRQALMFIERGAYAYVAAEALGISADTWYRWMRKGRQAKQGIYKTFFDDVTRSEGYARMLAEMQVRRDDPKFWLRVGPGKTKTGRPGWTETISVVGDEDMPIQVEHSGNVQVDIGTNIQDLAGVLVTMEELGIVQRTKLGQSVVSESATRIEYDSNIIDVDDGDSGTEEGYVPELTQKDGNHDDSNGNGNGKDHSNLL